MIIEIIFFCILLAVVIWVSNLISLKVSNEMKEKSPQWIMPVRVLVLLICLFIFSGALLFVFAFVLFDR